MKFILTSLLVWMSCTVFAQSEYLKFIDYTIAQPLINPATMGLEEGWNGLMMYQSCFEKTDFGTHAAVSVVTKNGRSDDANGCNLSGNTAWLRICRVNNSFSFLYSEDGTHFYMTRFFNLSGMETVKVGMLAQAPQGDGGYRVYENLTFEKRTVKNIRAGE